MLCLLTYISLIYPSPYSISFIYFKSLSNFQLRAFLKFSAILLQNFRFASKNCLVYIYVGVRVCVCLCVSVLAVRVCMFCVCVCVCGTFLFWGRCCCVRRAKIKNCCCFRMYLVSSSDIFSCSCSRTHTHTCTKQRNTHTHTHTRCCSHSLHNQQRFMTISKLNQQNVLFNFRIKKK